jgi:hypothetical protein
MPSEQELLEGLRSKALDGHALAAMVERGEISKLVRRKVTKIFKAETTKEASLTERQRLRREAKQKKMLPAKTREEQIAKFRKDLEKEREELKSQNSICLGCRKRGHILKYCPEVVKELGMCFNCGSSGHALKDCPVPRPRDGTLKFAKCFVCGGSGHIARDCAENANGLYPKGGCCHICMQKTHLAKDCPERTEEDKERFRRLREEREDAELGPRIGRTTTDPLDGGDDILDEIFEAHDREVDSDEEPRSSKKRKVSKEERKKSNKRRND